MKIIIYVLIALLLITACVPIGVYSDNYTNNLTGKECNSFCEEKYNAFNCDEWSSEWYKNNTTKKCDCKIERCINETN